MIILPQPLLVEWTLALQTLQRLPIEWKKECSKLAIDFSQCICHCQVVCYSARIIRSFFHPFLPSVHFSIRLSFSMCPTIARVRWFEGKWLVYTFIVLIWYLYNTYVIIVSEGWCFRRVRRFLGSRSVNKYGCWWFWRKVTVYKAGACFSLSTSIHFVFHLWKWIWRMRDWIYGLVFSHMLICCRLLSAYPLTIKGSFRALSLWPFLVSPRQ